MSFYHTLKQVFPRRGGGNLLRQLHELAEAESDLLLHERKLSEIEAKVDIELYCICTRSEMNEEKAL